MRTVTYYVACSVDGFIAQGDGSHDGFAQDPGYYAELFDQFPETAPTHLREPMGITAENRWFDTVLMGRKTYEIGQKEGIASPYTHLRQYLFSRSLKESPDANVQLVSDNAIEQVKQLKAEPGQGIWLCGGGDLAATLFTAQLVDQLILKVNPFLMGTGIPLFSGVIQQTPLELTQSQIYPNGVAMLHYAAKC
ncbi:MAG: dihydrofolate reductase family protein [Leptolyngbyaceae cyanobacterium]